MDIIQEVMKASLELQASGKTPALVVVPEARRDELTVYFRDMFPGGPGGFDITPNLIFGLPYTFGGYQLTIKCEGDLMDSGERVPSGKVGDFFGPPWPDDEDAANAPDGGEADTPPTRADAAGDRTA